MSSEDTHTKITVEMTIPELIVARHVLDKHAANSLFNVVWTLDHLLGQNQHYLGVTHTAVPTEHELELLMNFTGKTKEEVMAVWDKHLHFEGTFDALI